MGYSNLENHSTEPSEVSNQIKVWTQIFEQKGHDRIMKMREERDNYRSHFERERTNKNSSNPRSETNGAQIMQPSGSKTDESIDVHASNNINSEQENDDYLLSPSEMRELKRPASSLDRSILNSDETLVSNEDSEDEDYHILGINGNIVRLDSDQCRTFVSFQFEQ